VPDRTSVPKPIASVLRRWQRLRGQRWRVRHFWVRLAIAGITAGVGLVSVASYQVVRELILSSAKQSALQAVRADADEIDDWLSDRKAYVETMANSPVVRSLEWEEIIPYFQREEQRLDDFLNFALLRPDGRFTNSRGQEGNVADRSYFSTVMDGNTIVSDPLVSRITQIPAIVIAAPIYDSDTETGAPAAAMSGLVEIERFTEIVNELTYGEGSYGFALDSQENAITHPVAEDLETSETEILSELAAITRHSNTDLQGDIEAARVGGESVYVAYAPLESVNWALALVIPRSTIEAPLKSLNILTGVLGTIVAVATVFALRQVSAFEQTRARAAKEALLNRLTNRLHSSLDLDKTLPPTLEELADRLDAERVAFCWFDKDNSQLNVECEYHRPQLSSWTGTLSAEDLEDCLRRRRSLELTTETGDTLKLKGEFYSADAISAQVGMSAYLLCVYDRPIPADTDEAQLMGAVGKQLAIAVTQARLYSSSQTALAALEREREQLQQVIANAPVAMALVDRHLRVLAHSSKWLSDYHIEGPSIVDRHLPEVFPDWPEKAANIFESAFNGQVVTDPEDVWERADGTQLYLRWAVHPWYDSNGEIGGAIVASARIDDLVMARQEAQRTAEFKTRFLANMSHEIRTPMNGVLGMTSLLLRTPLKTQQQDYARGIQRSAKHLLAIINDILDFSKLEAGEMDLESIDFDLHRCLEDVLDVVASQAEDKGLEIATPIDRDVPRKLKGDPSRLRQVLLNLISNAIKFTDRGEVVVEVKVDGMEGERKTELETQLPINDLPITLRFNVKDTGIGISSEAQNRLFQSFSQVDASTTREYGGTGLGLAICQQLVTLMGGNIGVDSVEGLGSIFWFTARFGKQTGFHPEEMPLKMSRLRLLVAAESATTRQAVRYFAYAWGMEHIDEAPNGKVALTAIRDAATEDEPYDIAILDLQLPDFNSDRLIQTVRKDRAFDDTKLVLMSTLKQQQIAEQLVELGVDSYFLKPVRASRLFDALVSAIAPQLDDSEDEPTPLEPTSASLTGLKILLAEDHPTNQQVMLAQLDEYGCEVDCANNGQEALDRITETAYDAVLMDCQMPVLDGYEATGELRRREEHGNSRTVVIALTAHALPQDREKCLASGMDDYISKPVDIEDLVALLERWTGRTETETPDDKASQNGHCPDTESDFPLDLQRLHKISRGKVQLQHRLIAAFLDASDTDVDDLAVAIDNNDLEAVRDRAHRLKGAAANVGARSLSQRAAELEALAVDRNLDAASPLLAGIENDLRRIHAYLEELSATSDQSGELGD